jgi:hypothetical protein
MTGDPDRVRFFLEQLALSGITPEEILAAAGKGPAPVAEGPTVAEYVTRIEGRFKETTRATYATHWRLLVELRGGCRLGELDSDDLAELVAEAGRRARIRRPSCTGRSAEENCVAALRALYLKAVKARVVSFNPASELDKPSRLENRRRALTASELSEVWETVTIVSRDPELDLLLVRFHVETGARRIGAPRAAAERPRLLSSDDLADREVRQASRAARVGEPAAGTCRACRGPGCKGAR